MEIDYSAGDDLERMAYPFGEAIKHLAGLSRAAGAVALNSGGTVRDGGGTIFQLSIFGREVTAQIVGALDGKVAFVWAVGIAGLGIEPVVYASFTMAPDGMTSLHNGRGSMLFFEDSSERTRTYERVLNNMLKLALSEQLGLPAAEA